jgi:putative ABC transport system substrate-binding protein
MRRRTFVTLLGGAAAWPLTARAQQADGVRRIGVLMNLVATDARPQAYVAVFSRELRQLGWIEGQNIRIDIRWSGGDAQLARLYAAQLIGLQPHVILTASTTNLTAIREATTTIPVVFTEVSDPVAQGFVASLTNPGGNLTGFSMYEFSIGGKWVDLLKEIAPDLARVAVMFNPDTSPQSKFFMRSIGASTPSLGVEVIVLPVRATADIEPALDSFAREPNGGLILPTDSFTQLRQKMIADLGGRNRLPSVSAQSEFAKDGGLMSYSANVNLMDQFRQAAGYVDRILKGWSPTDLPIQQPTKFELMINLKTAKTLGLDIPSTLLARADEVIE